MLEFTLHIYMCSHCTRVYNLSETCQKHEQERHCAKETNSTPRSNTDNFTEQRQSQQPDPADDDNDDQPITQPVEPNCKPVTQVSHTSLESIIDNRRSESTDNVADLCERDIKPVTVALNGEHGNDSVDGSRIGEPIADHKTPDGQFAELEVEPNRLAHPNTIFDVTNQPRFDNQNRTTEMPSYVIHKESLERQRQFVDLQHEASVNRPLATTTENICMICSRSFTRADHLRLHLRLHCDERPYKCTNCERRFATESMVQNHACKQNTVTNPTFIPNRANVLKKSARFLDTKHQLPSRRPKMPKTRFTYPYICAKCRKTFSKPSELRRHIDGSLPMVGRDVKCDLCCQHFKDEHNRKVHRLAIHDNVRRTYTTDMTSVRRQTVFIERRMRNEKSNGFLCPMCPKKCVGKFDLEKHLKSAHCGEKPFVCDKCAKRYKRVIMIKLHVCNGGRLAVGDKENLKPNVGDVKL